jgi:membrane fusion protein (multidrug efflux system)
VVTKDNKAESRPVVVGDWHGDDWFITEGLHAGDVVVVDGGQGLQSGVAVAPKPLLVEKSAIPDGAPPAVKSEKKSK